jgi:predicted dehydrogenase
MPQKLTVVFLGVNHPHMFRRIDLFNRMEDVEVLGFYEEDDWVAGQFAAVCPYKRFAHLDDALGHRPDLVLVEAELTKIAPYAKAAAPYTRALLLEKCTAPNLAVALDLADELRRYPVHVVDGFVIRYLEVIEKCKEILASGVMGQVTLARFHSTFPAGFGVEKWQSDPACSGGIVYTEGGHMADLMLETLGMPDSVHGSIVKLPPGEKLDSLFVWADTFRNLRGQPVEVQVGDLMYEDVGAAILHYPDKLATFDVTAWAPDKGKGWSMEFVGTNAVMTVYPWQSRLEMSVAAAKGGYSEGAYTFDPGSRAPNGDGAALISRTYATQLERLLDLLRTDAAPSQQGLERIINIIRLMDGVFRSSTRGVDLSPPLRNVADGEPGAGK